ncbi:MAG: glycosyltransferase family 2 protein, partial [Candidatus Omnitrophica bacterium]|nr:glycosyltransferase family 2 protein [Candidatus Omnitrophota bacterium]
MNTTKNSQNIISDKTAKSISCVIPVYNDELTIEYIVNELIFTLENLKADYEIILINDGSPDRGGEIINKLALAHKNIKTIHHKVNLGYGQTLRDGFALATKKFIFITDGDGQYEMRDLNQAWFKVNERHAIIGYPRRRADGLKRIVVSKIYNTLCLLF